MGQYPIGMTVEHDAGTMTCRYETGGIAAIHLEFQSADLPTLVTVSFRDGGEARWECKYLDGYHRQFGVSVSRDGSRVFAQTWEMGVLCFDSRTGQRLWKTKSRRGVTTMVANEKTLCCHRHEYALQLLDMETGEVLVEKRPAKSWGADILTERYLLCRTTARKCEIICTEDLRVVASLTRSELLAVEAELKAAAPAEEGNWCFRGAEYDGKSLLLDYFWTGKSRGSRIVPLPYRICE